MKALLFLFLFACPALSADPVKLAPFKDKLFQHGKILEKKDKGDFFTVDYKEKRDVNGRDEIPVKKAKAERVEILPAGNERDLAVAFEGGSMDTVEVGDPKGADFAVIFIHGGGGDKSLGANDWTFGGNFNRLKNLAVKNKGVYYSPSVTFDEQGEKGVLAIIKRVKAQSPEAKVVVACGSAGGEICTRLSNNEEAAEKLAGLVSLGTASSFPNFTDSPAFKNSVAMVYAHGSRDPILDWKTLHGEYEKIRRAKLSYPQRFMLYNRGNHGTPIRLIDWKETLNWIFAQKREDKAKPAPRKETKAAPAQEAEEAKPATVNSAQ
jgi:hypothetical protein